MLLGPCSASDHQDHPSSAPGLNPEMSGRPHVLEMKSRLAVCLECAHPLYGSPTRLYLLLIIGGERIYRAHGPLLILLKGPLLVLLGVQMGIKLGVFAYKLIIYTTAVTSILFYKDSAILFLSYFTYSPFLTFCCCCCSDQGLHLLGCGACTLGLADDCRLHPHDAVLCTVLV